MAKKKRVKAREVFDEVKKERYKKGFFFPSIGKIIWFLLLIVIPVFLWYANVMWVNQLPVQIIFGLLMIPLDIAWIFFAYFFACIFSWVGRRSGFLRFTIFCIYLTINLALAAILFIILLTSGAL